MSKIINITYVFIGNFNTNQTVTEQVIKFNPQSQKEFKVMFEKLSKLQDKKVDQRNKIQGKETNYYFVTNSRNYFILVEAVSQFPERQVFSFIEELTKENIEMVTNEDGTMSTLGKHMLTQLIDKYQTTDRIHEVQSDLDSIRIDMKSAIGSQVRNLEDIGSLDGKSQQLKISAEAYKKDARELKRVTWWKNFKLTVIIILAIILLVLIIVLPIVFTSSSASSSVKSN